MIRSTFAMGKSIAPVSKCVNEKFIFFHKFFISIKNAYFLPFKKYLNPPVKKSSTE